jgi:hypothetical protein
LPLGFWTPTGVIIFNAGKFNSFSVYTRVFFRFCSSGAVRGLAFTSLAGGRWSFDFDLEMRDAEDDKDGLPFLLVAVGLDGFVEEPLLGAIVDGIIGAVQRRTSLMGCRGITADHSLSV